MDARYFYLEKSPAMYKLEIGDRCRGGWASHPGRVSYTDVGVLTHAVNLTTFAKDPSAPILPGKGAPILP
jgi:hypothetical protein